MNIEQALEFLKKHQPLPSDEDISEDEIDTFNKVMKFFISNPDERCIPLMMNVFGDEDGYGVYQLCDDVFNKYESCKVLPHLKAALKSSHYGVRYWASQWAMDINSIDIVPEINSILTDPKDAEAHYYCMAALMDIWHKTNDPKVSKSIVELGSKSPNNDVNEILQEHETELNGL